MQDRAEGLRNGGGALSLDVCRMDALNGLDVVALQGVWVGLGMKDPFWVMESPGCSWGSHVEETKTLKCMSDRTKGTDIDSQFNR